MLRVLACLGGDHDLALVALAVLILAGAAGAAAMAAQHARAGRERHRAWTLLLAAACLGGGAWSTHFVAMLAYEPGLPTAYDPAITLGSAALAVAGAAAGLLLWLRAEGAGGRALGGAVAGASIVAMHYLGMAAVRLPGHLEWSPDLVLGSGAVGIALMAGGLARLRPEGSALPAASLLVAAVAGLHFIGMGAVLVVPDPAVPVPATVLPRPWLAALVAVLTLAWLGTGVAAALIQTWLGRRRRAAEAERLRGLADATFEALALCDAEGTIVDANARLGELLGEARPALLGRRLDDLLAADAAAGPAPVAALAARQGSLTATLGGRTPVEVLARPIETGAGPRLVIALRDLRERIAAEARIRHLAHHDPLTGLPNRARLVERMEEALAGARRGGPGFAVLYLDLDRFKPVNDLYGHGAGDRLLREAAQRLRAEVRESDMVARLGGDEFAILMAPAAGPGAAAALAERLVRSLALPFDLGEGAIASVSVSIGIALHPADAQDAEALLRAADTALYRVKSAGRDGHAFFQPEMDQDLRLRRALEQDIRLAPARGELALHYQPVAAAETGEVIGFEALLRWHHPRHGQVPPDVFIPIAEASGGILRLGEWALAEACREAARWPRPLRVAVNVSPIQIQHADFCRLLARTLGETGLAPERLEIEVTESLFVSEVERALETLRGVKALGVRVALDDFGTGYSSLGTLRTFPFDKIKVDRSFVRGLGGDEQARAIVRAVLGLGRGMRLPVVAEGVETPAQLRELRQENCDEVQGYLIGRPQPIEAYAAMTGARAADASPVAA
ncbi:bifunctional diguanylate cyclase/phosphodiesterase [Crenalkalicoccus roseus]|uniref:bifunctional diguanylate cyclase/phosphodiesterase n=1 Tax=Crenalkalicoccus roseus TaxID=1485588 RepID=UPI001081A492|nr:EAL domain-containing protein [Crenalkalicoccus roseus]